MKKNCLLFLISLLFVTLILNFVSCDNNKNNDAILADDTYSPIEIYELVNPSVVYINILTQNGESAGSGFFINDTGRVITNYHVIEKGVSGTITTNTGKIYNITNVVGYDSNMDIAILDTTCEKSHAANFKKGVIETGAEVYAIGYPQSFIIGNSSSTFTEGIVSNNSLSFQGKTYIQISTPITNGNSGGALINANAEVVGITSAKINIEGVDYFNLAIPIAKIDDINTSTPKSLREVNEENKILSISVTLDRSSYEIYKGDTFRIVATIYPSNSDDTRISWTSSNPEIATVDDKGIVTGIECGTATITATTSNGKTATARIIVSRKVEYLTFELTSENYSEYINISCDLINSSYTGITVSSKYSELVFSNLKLQISVCIQGLRYYPDQSYISTDYNTYFTHFGLGHGSYRTTNGWFEGSTVKSFTVTSITGTVSGYFYVD